MATIVSKLEYKCSDDCLQKGCPSHNATLTYQSCSDAYTFDNGKGDIKEFERGELEAFIQLIKGLDRADSIKLI